MQTNEQPNTGRQLPPPTAGTRYDRFRGEVMAGGSVTTREPDDEPFGGGGAGAIAGLAIIGMFVWLGFTSGWMLFFAVGVLVSVFLHELGHFVTARMTGMKATQFFIGFGPRLWSFHRGETEYGVRLLPLGAFVRIIGMNNLDEVPPADEARTYRQKSYPRRMLVITAGSLMHLLLAIVLLFGVFAIRGELVDRAGAEVGDVAAESGAACSRHPPWRHHPVGRGSDRRRRRPRRGRTAVPTRRHRRGGRRARRRAVHRGRDTDREHQRPASSTARRCWGSRRGGATEWAGSVDRRSGADVVHRVCSR